MQTGIFRHERMVLLSFPRRRESRFLGYEARKRCYGAEPQATAAG